MRAAASGRAFLLAESAVLAALLLAWSLFSHGGLTAADWFGFLLAATPLAIAAMVQTVPILAGGQGLAAGATALLVVAVIGAAPIDGAGSAVLWSLIGVGLGGVIGLGNGILIGYLRVPSTGVTYATGAAVGALAFLLAGNGGALQQPQALQDLLFGPQLFGLPIVPLLLVAALAAGGVVLRRARFGRALHAVGVRLTLAERTLPAARLRCGAYLLAGLGYGLAGVVLAGQVGVLDSMLAMPILLQIFAAAALGGSCPGLRAGGVVAALLGAGIVAAAANLFVPLGFPDVLSTAVDAGWLLIGLAACCRFADRPPHIAAMAATPIVPMRSVAILTISAVLLLGLAWLRPEAGTVATVGVGLGLLALGQGAVIRSGGFDLSMPAVISFAGLASVAIAQGSWSRFMLAVLVILPVAGLVGVWHGLLAGRMGRGVVLLTLASGGILQALAAAMDVWMPTGFVPLDLTAFVARQRLGLPAAVWLLLPLGLVAAAVLDRAWSSGARDPRVAYVASALAAALFGILMAAVGGGFRLGIVDTSLVPAVAGAVIGGVRFARGSGSLLAALGATMALQVADTLLVMLGLGYEARLMAMALAMLIAATVPQLLSLRPRPGARRYR